MKLCEFMLAVCLKPNEGEDSLVRLDLNSTVHGEKLRLPIKFKTYWWQHIAVGMHFFNRAEDGTILEENMLKAAKDFRLGKRFIFQLDPKLTYSLNWLSLSYFAKNGQKCYSLVMQSKINWLAAVVAANKVSTKKKN